MTDKSKKLVNKTFFTIFLTFFISGIFLISFIELPNYKKTIKMIKNNYYYFFQSQSSYIEKIFTSYEEKSQIIANSVILKNDFKLYYSKKIKLKEFKTDLDTLNRTYLKQFDEIYCILNFDINKNIIYTNKYDIPESYLSTPKSYSVNSFVQGIIKINNKKLIKVFTPVLDNNGNYIGYNIIFFNTNSIDNFISQKYTINNIDLNIDLYQIINKNDILRYSDFQKIKNTKFVELLNKASHRISKTFFKIDKSLYNFKRINYSNWFIGFTIDSNSFKFITIYSLILYSLLIFFVFLIILIIIRFLLKPYSNKVILTMEQMDNKIQNLTFKLKSERDKYLKYLDNIGNIFLVQKPNGDLIYINKQGEKFLGYTKEELSGKQWFNKVHKNDSRLFVENIFKKIMEKDHSLLGNSISPIYDRFNRKKIIQWTNSFIEDQNGNIVEVFSSGIDITEKIKLIKEIQENIQQIEFIINSLNLFIWQIKIHKDGTIFTTYLSSSFSNITGIDYNILLYSNYDYLYFVIPEDREKIINLRNNVQSGNSYTIEYRFKKANGDIIWLKDFAYPYKKEGDYILINGFSVEVTKEKENEVLLKRIFESISELGIGIIMYGNINNKEGIITYCNPAITSITGYSQEEIINKKTVFDFLQKEDKILLLHRYRNRFAGQKTISHFKTNIINKNGIKRIIDLMITTQKIENKRYIIAILIDITEKEKLEQKLFVKQKMEAIGFITSGIAHDLNNILGGMLGYLELMKMETKDNNLLEYINQIAEGGNRAKKFISNLLGYSRKGRLEKKVLNINEKVSSALKLVEPTINKNIKINLFLEERLNLIDGDPGQIEQIIINLCINGCQAMPEGGTLSIKTENFTIDKEFSLTHFNIPPGNYIRLSVQDSGIGMDQETLNKIFDPFFTTKKTEKGTGLGLATVYGIVKNHNGIITVYSEPGKGSIFKVYLPVSRTSVLKKEETSLIDDSALIKGSGTILVIDDEKILQNVLIKMLHKLGFEILIAENGKKGISIYEKNKNDIKLVLLDINMPVMGGKACFTQLKKINPDLKVLIITGFALNDEIQELLDMGAKGYLKKPFDFNSLSGKLKELLNL